MLDPTTMRPIGGVSYPAGGQGGVQARPESGGFDELLRQKLEQEQARTVAFSKHARERAEERGIEVTPTLIDRLTGRPRPRAPPTSWPWTAAWPSSSTSPTAG